MFDSWRAIAPGLTIAGLFLTGCNNSQFQTREEVNANRKPSAGHAHGHDHDHGHGAKGPHGGALIELGDDEFHGELVVNHDTHSVVVYLLGKDAKTAVTTTAPDLTLVIGKTPHTLKAKVEGGEAGKASVFTLESEEVVDRALDDGFIHGSLKVKINDKAYNGEVDAHFEGSAHDHDHDKPKGDQGAAKGADGASSAAPVATETPPAESAKENGGQQPAPNDAPAEKSEPAGDAK